jgi:D-sedoheptulose 7-phosphate isomerase
MNTGQWLRDYFDVYQTQAFSPELFPDLEAFRDMALSVREQKAKFLFQGNGASAAIASHASVDFTKQGGVRAVNFNEADLITCFANDYGYENWIAKAIEFYADPKDVVVLISCSGRSPSVVNAAHYAKEAGHTLVTLTGHKSDNPLRAQGDLNFWVDSKAYNIVECIHMIWLTTVIDLVIGKAEYAVS